MSESLPNPMPDDPELKAELEEKMRDMQSDEADAHDWVVEKIEEGLTPRQILDELGNEAESILGTEATRDLQKAETEDVSDQAEHVAELGERDTWVEILERLDRGESDSDLVEAFKDRGGLERLIGSSSANLIMEQARKEKTNG